MTRKASRAQRKAPVRLVETTASHSESSKSSNGAERPKIPALLNKKSIRPRSSRACENKRFTDDGSVTSHLITMPRSAAAPDPASVSRSGSSRRPASTTSHEPASKESATWRPIPDPAPVTTATRSGAFISILPLGGPLGKVIEHPGRIEDRATVGAARHRHVLAGTRIHRKVAFDRIPLVVLADEVIELLEAA